MQRHMSHAPCGMSDTADWNHVGGQRHAKSVPEQFLAKETWPWVRSDAKGLGLVMQTMQPDMDINHTAGAMMHWLSC